MKFFCDTTKSKSRFRFSDLRSVNGKLNPLSSVWWAECGGRLLLSVSVLTSMALWNQYQYQYIRYQKWRTLYHPSSHPAFQLGWQYIYAVIVQVKMRSIGSKTERRGVESTDPRRGQDSTGWSRAEWGGAEQGRGGREQAQSCVDEMYIHSHRSPHSTGHLVFSTSFLLVNFSVFTSLGFKFRSFLCFFRSSIYPFTLSILAISV